VPSPDWKPRADKHKPIPKDQGISSRQSEKKEIEKLIYHEHKKLQGLTDLNAKLRYVQLSRSPEIVWNQDIFLVQERAKRNKLECPYRCDEIKCQLSIWRQRK
jgi:hypothetical protein